MRVFSNPSWYRALTLAERAMATPQSHLAPTDPTRAEQRWQYWEKQVPLSADLLAQKFQQDGVDKGVLTHLLGESDEAISERMPHRPGWLQALEDSYRSVADKEAQPGTPEEQAASLLNLYAPLIRASWHTLQDSVQELAGTFAVLPFDPDNVASILFADLPIRLFKMISRTAILELNIARLQGKIVGETPQERFQFFAEQLLQSDVALSLWQTYPVLTRQVHRHLKQWVAFGLEFLRHLCEDWADMLALLSPEVAPGRLTAIQGGAGDRHRQGRCVIIAQFSSGFEVVYKPKSLATELHFQQLLGWLNEQGVAYPFRTFEILTRPGHGWVEFINPEGCQTKDQLNRFYHRFGAYLALFYILEATDFHFENLIAAGEHPMPIDLESLFHPRPDQTEVSVLEHMMDSVLRIGLLPQRMWSNDHTRSIDISGLGTPGGQLSPFAVAYLEDGGTDTMHISRKAIPIPDGANRPSLKGQAVDVLAFSDVIIAGFASLYTLLMAQKEALFAENGPFTRFINDEVRAICRPTHIYVRILEDSFHPDLLRDGLDRDRYFDQLWFNTTQQPYLAELIPHERADLLNGDVPIFTTRPDSRDLWTSTGQRLPNFLSETPLEAVQRRLNQLSEHDLWQQQWFISASLSALVLGRGNTSWQEYEFPTAQGEAPQAALLQGAEAIAQRLLKLALPDEPGMTWIGLSMIGDHAWTLMPLGLDLYGGLPGLAFFFAYLGKATGNQTYTAHAEAIVRLIQSMLAQPTTRIDSVGGFDGWGGLIYVFTHLGVLWQRADLLADAERMATEVAMNVSRDRFYDVLSGTAGAVLALLALYEVHPAGVILDIASQCGDKLLAEAQPMAQGLGWSSLTDTPLTGFSHGAAGVAYALLKLAHHSGQARFREAAQQAIAYERSQFMPERGNWLDLREADPESQQNNMAAWCHGAAGIGLARHLSRPYLTNDAQIGQEIDIALQTTLAQGLNLNHCLCHGDLGNLELLLQLSQARQDTALHQRTYTIAQQVLGSIEQEGWLCGVPLNAETPGLLTGIAGIGYGLLRLAAPAHVPALLALAPPYKRRIPS